MEQTLQQCLREFHSGGTGRAFEALGCHAETREGTEGFVFRVWAPNAQSVSVVGDFNFWNEQDLPMAQTDGVWEAFSANAKLYHAYKYCVFTRDGRKLYKTDPYGNRCCRLPDTSSVIDPPGGFVWHDAAYRKKAQAVNPLQRPVNIYEVHAGSWKQHPDGSYLSYVELAAELIPYVKDMPNVVIEPGAQIICAIIAEGCHIGAGAQIGAESDGGRKITVIGKDKQIADGSVIEAGAVV